MNKAFGYRDVEFLRHLDPHKHIEYLPEKCFYCKDHAIMGAQNLETRKWIFLCNGCMEGVFHGINVQSQKS